MPALFGRRHSLSWLPRLTRDGCLHDYLDTSILLASSIAIVAGDREVRTQTLDRDACRIDRVTGQVIPHRLRAPLRQIQIVFAAAGSVGMPFDRYRAAIVVTQGDDQLVQGALRSGFQFGTIDLEQNVAQGNHQSALGALGLQLDQFGTRQIALYARIAGFVLSAAGFALSAARIALRAVGVITGTTCVVLCATGLIASDLGVAAL
jgi:hypothetical protein